MSYISSILKKMLIVLPFFVADYAFAENNIQKDLYDSSNAYLFGATYYFDDNLQRGFYLGFNESKIKTENRLKSDRLLYSLGSESNIILDNNLYLKSQISLSGTDKQMSELNSGTSENDKKSYTIYSGVSAGYISKLDSNTVIVPEIGISYLQTSNLQANFFFIENPGYAESVGKSYYGAMYASLMVNLQGSFLLEDNSFIQPSIGVGFRRNISGSEVAKPLNIARDNSRLDISDENRILLQTGITWSDENSSVDLHYNGEYGNEKKFHAGEIKIKYKF